MTDIGKAIRKANNTPFIKYYPELGKMFNSICAAVLLKKIDYLFEANGNEPFYKFKEPCGHELYQVGRSWTEELGVNRGEFEGALLRLKAVKVTKGVKLNEVKLTSLIVYYTDKNRLTWYWLNVEKYEQLLETAFTIKSGKDDLLYKAEKSLYIEKGKSDFTFPIKELNKDKSEEQKKFTRTPKVKKQPSQANPNAKSESYWQNEYLNNPDLMANLRVWCADEAKQKIGLFLSIFRHTYTEQQLNAYCDHYASILDVPIYKTHFTQLGRIVSCDLVQHILSKAKYEFEKKGSINIPLPKKEQVKRILPADDLFKF